jgi:riboflavin synthase
VFTGLIADLGSVSAVAREDAGATLTIRTGLAGELREGDSVAVNGVCLTATSVRDGGFQAEAMIETLNRSSLGVLQPGDAVNLELPLRAADRLGGHFVQGHVDGTGTLLGSREQGFSRVLSIAAGPELTRYLVEKGSVALDGVSLTVSALAGESFEVSLIPETLQRTNLGRAAPGARINIEVDVLAKHIERLMEART